MEKIQFCVEEKIITLYPAAVADAPLVVLNTYTGDGSSVYAAMQETGCPDGNLLVVGNLEWNHDMTPWFAPPLIKGEAPCTGGGEEYLSLLTKEILPKAQKHICGVPSHVGIAGYSLGGLFALYAAYRCDAFEKVASMSGSFWFPDFKDYVFSNEMKRRPEKIYFSLGDKEARTRNPILKRVQENTEEIAGYLRQKGMDVTLEMNPGNHFKDAALRSAKGIAAIL